MVMEVELNEPGLFFTYAPAAAEQFADAIWQHLPSDRPIGALALVAGMTLAGLSTASFVSGVEAQVI